MPKNTKKQAQKDDHEVIRLFERMVEKWRKGSEHEDDHTELGKKLFRAIARLSVSISFEAIALRKNKGKIEVFMTKRLPHETYAGQWHCPGSIFRPGEKPKDVLKRLVRKEFKVPVTSRDHCIKDFFVRSEIGWMLCRVYPVTIKGKPENGEWFDVKKLPKNTVGGHRSLFIPAAVKNFLEK